MCRVGVKLCATQPNPIWPLHSELCRRGTENNACLLPLESKLVACWRITSQPTTLTCVLWVQFFCDKFRELIRRKWRGARLISNVRTIGPMFQISFIVGHCYSCVLCSAFDVVNRHCYDITVGFYSFSLYSVVLLSLAVIWSWRKMWKDGWKDVRIMYEMDGAKLRGT